MKKVFVKTNNVKRFITMMNNLQNRAEGVPGMALVYGEQGFGKVQAINWWAFKNDAILVKCTQLMTARWLLNEIMDEMGEVNCGRLADCFKIIIRNLLTEPQVIIIDEVDYLAIDSRAIETLRGIHDKMNIPIALVGMSNAKSRIKRFKHLYDRLAEIVQFKPFSKNHKTEYAYVPNIIPHSQIELSQKNHEIKVSKSALTFDIKALLANHEDQQKNLIMQQSITNGILYNA